MHAVEMPGQTTEMKLLAGPPSRQPAVPSCVCCAMPCCRPSYDPLYPLEYFRSISRQLGLAKQIKVQRAHMLLMGLPYSCSRIFRFTR